MTGTDPTMPQAHGPDQSSALDSRRGPDLLALVVGLGALGIAVATLLGGCHELNLSRGTSYNVGSRVRSMVGAMISTSSISTRNCTRAESRWLVWPSAECSLSPMLV